MLLEIRDLSVSFSIRGEWVRAIDSLSLSIAAGEAVGLVGESGSGKSVTCLAILRLLASGSARIDSGTIVFSGRELTGLSETEMRGVRGREISMIFQEPMTSLNPVFSIGEQIGEVLRLHRGLSRHDARLESIRALELVKIPDAAQRVRDYPHQLSGGMRQRVMIAMALACRPKLLLADEPTTALDVTIQAQILELIRQLQQEMGMALLLVSHDLGVVAQNCRRVLVMYGGKLVEQGDVQEVLSFPQHPYTNALLGSMPRLGARVEHLAAIPGTVPAIGKFPLGCRFAGRCPVVLDRCSSERPPRFVINESHNADCWRLVSEAK
jgi:oligopeptide/dipeptide ABC transporter ATP-binding protein